MSQVGGTTAGRTAGGVETRERDRASPKPVDLVRWHPASLDPEPAPRDESTRRPRAPQLVTAGLVLLTAAGVLEGYRWLQVIPSGRLHPSALLFVVLVVPTTLFLTRPPRPWVRTPSERVAVAAVAGLTVVTVVETVTGKPWSADLLGASDLTTAVAILTAALTGAGAFAR